MLASGTRGHLRWPAPWRTSALALRGGFREATRGVRRRGAVARRPPERAMPTCAACGGPVADGARTCPACGAAFAGPAPLHDVVSFPPPGPVRAGSPEVTAPPAPPEPPPASIGDRALAIVLDSLVPLAAFVLIATWLGPWLGTTTTEGFSFEGWPAVLLGAVVLLVALVYQTCLEWWFGTTLGKLVAGARVRGRDGRRPDARAALLRNLLRFVDGLGLYLVGAFAYLLTRRRQRVGDLAAGTTVVRDEPSTLLRVGALVLLVALPAGAFALLAARAGGTGGVALTTAGPTETGGAAGQQAPPTGTAAGALTIVNARLAASRSGPDRPDAVFKPGDTPTLRFDVSGYGTAADGGPHLRLNMRTTDPFGVVVNEDPASDVQPGATGGAPVKSWATVSLPGYAPPGAYRFDVTVTDVIASRSITTSAVFTVDAPPIEPADSLILQRVRFTEGEDGPPRGGTAFDTGSEIHLAFDIAGFRAGEGGHVKISETLQMLAADDQKILEGQVLRIDERYAYLPRRIGASNRVKTGQIPPGDYRLRMILDDEIGGQQRVEEVKLSIR